MFRIDSGFAKKRARWIIVALLDQALYGLSNFIVNIGLAKLLSVPDFGAVAIVYAAMFLFWNVQSGIFYEPMMVLGAGRFRDDVHGYLRRMLVVYGGCSLVSIPTTVVVALVFGLVTSPSLSAAFLAAAPTAPLIFLNILLRRACFLVGGASSVLPWAHSTWRSWSAAGSS